MITAVAKKGKIKIDPSKEINQGGEGTVYEIDSNTVAKIYHPGIKPIDPSKFRFLSSLDPNYFVAPIELLYNEKGIVIGYTMAYINQQEFYPLSNIYSKRFCASNGIDKKIKMKIIEKLISAVKYAHKEDVVIGDLNPYNILVNDRGVVKFIDTDSYQTPGSKHSDRLLEDIRDYMYQGRVSKDSDFFALSVLSFNMLAFLHPFKGMHKQYKKMADRMIHKLPVFINDPDIKIPKCYEPIKDKNFMDQFKRLYLDGERFILTLSGVDGNIIAVSPLAKPDVVKSYEQDELIITMISQGEEIMNIFFLNNQGMIETEHEFVIYSTRNKGYVNLKHRINKKDWDKVFIGEEKILLKKDEKLYLYKGGDKYEEMKNFTFPDKHIITQMGNTLIVVGEGDMYKLFLDEIGPEMIVMKNLPVFGKGFTNHNGFIHNSSGKQNIFYNSGKDVSIVQSPVKLKGVYQDKNVGIFQYEEKKKVRQKFFKIGGMDVKVSQVDIDGMRHFAYIPNVDSSGKPQSEGMIFSPEDDKIFIYRTNDFEKIGEMNCSLITSQSVLQKSNAGIIVWEGSEVAILNKK
jgi:serine/threonine protein kinase